jgi:hypothetical protein
MNSAAILVNLVGLVAIPVAAQRMFVYQKRLSPQQQDIDTAERTRWATRQRGVDPNAPTQPAQAGIDARDTLGGAAMGAAIR